MDQLILTHPPKRISRDEMNLAEFPLSVLSTRSNPKLKTLEFSDSVRGRNGEIIDRRWIITGADKFGLPTASDDEVLLGLLKLTVDDGMESRKVCFTRYEILKTLKWTTEGRSYLRLQRALDRLSGVRIKATNAFYDNESKSHSTRNFGIIDAYEVNHGRGCDKPSFFVWSEVLFKSFQVGFIKKLDFDFYLKLQSAISKRVYRFLDKHFWYRSTLQLNLFTFAHEKVGISRNYRYTSSIRQQLDPAIEELLRVGFLSGCEYRGRGAATEIVLLAGRERGKPLTENSREVRRQKGGLEDRASDPKNLRSDELGAAQPPRAAAPNAGLMQALPRHSFSVGPAGLSTGLLHTELRASAAQAECDEISADYASLERALMNRGIKASQIERLLRRHGPEMLAKIAEIIRYFDLLVASQSARVSRSPVGFLYRAVESPETFVLPNQQRNGRMQTALALPQGSHANVGNPAFNASDNGAVKAESRTAGVLQQNGSRSASSDMSGYLVWRKQEILKLRGSVEQEMLAKIEREVRDGLVKIRGLISDARFEEAIVHGVDERLAKLFSVPDLEEWDQQRRKRPAPH